MWPWRARKLRHSLRVLSPWMTASSWPSPAVSTNPSVTIRRFERPRARRLHRVDEFLGEDLGFLGEVAGASPVAGLRSFASVFEEALDLGDQVGLRGVQGLALGGREVFLSDVETFVRFLPRGGGLLLGELRCDGGSLRFFGVGDWRRRRRSRCDDARPRRRAAHRNHHGCQGPKIRNEHWSFELWVVGREGLGVRQRSNLDGGGP